MSGSGSDSPNRARLQYLCKTCGVEVAAYESHCARHVEVAEVYEKPNLLDRFMHRLLGTGRRRSR